MSHSLTHSLTYLLTHLGALLDIKLIDFGMAHHLNDGATKVMSAKSYGTRIYLAPESYTEDESGNREYSTQTDLWQCGTHSLTYSRIQPFSHSVSQSLTHLHTRCYLIYPFMCCPTLPE